MTVTLPWPPAILSPNARAHWAARSKAGKAYRHACWALTKQAGLRIDWEGEIHVCLDYLPPDRRLRDQDNMIAASKAALDGLADALGVNDQRFRLHPVFHRKVGGMLKVHLAATKKEVFNDQAQTSLERKSG